MCGVCLLSRHTPNFTAPSDAVFFCLRSAVMMKKTCFSRQGRITAAVPISVRGKGHSLSAFSCRTIEKQRRRAVWRGFSDSLCATGANHRTVDSLTAGKSRPSGHVPGLRKRKKTPPDKTEGVKRLFGGKPLQIYFFRFASGQTLRG